jgi:haloalkane dehalogenase
MTEATLYDRLPQRDLEIGLAREVVAALPRMRVPTLILWGEPDDYFRPPELQRLHALVPHTEVRRLPGGGHFPQEDAPEATSDALRAFLRDTG